MSRSRSRYYLTSDHAGATVPSIPCPPDGNTASYSVEIKQTDKYDLFWGLRFPQSADEKKTSRGQAD